jgi:4-amino-4-deoxy-L-arabinose transferase-like glycosyltransferase
MLNKYKRYIPFTYFLILAFIVFANNGSVSLWDQDEAAYAGFAKGMMNSGNWLIPDFMWSEIHRKPPLHFWDIGISYQLFGINEFSVRFPSALFLLLTYIFIYVAGTPLFGKKMAFLGAVVLSTSLFIPSLAKVSVTDATLLFFSTVCAFALLHIMQERSLKWTLAFWAAFAMALLTKGPPVILFTAVFAILLFAFHPNRKNLFSMHPWIFLPLACVPIFWWAYLVYQKDGGVFISWMIDWYILKRVNSSVLGQTGPPGTHLFSIFVFFIPYFMFLPKALWNAISSAFRKEKGINFLLSAWFISGWFLYEWSPSKLPSYVIVAHVPFALLIAKEIISCLEEKRLPSKALVIGHLSLILIVFTALLIGPQFLEIPSAVKISFAIAAGLLIACTIFIAFHLRSSRFMNLVLGTNILFQILVWTFLLPSIDQLKNGSKVIADYVNKNAVDQSLVLIANKQGHPPSLPFYLSLNFSQVQEESNLDILLNTFQSKVPCVLILNKEQRDFSAKKFPDANFKEVRSMLTDRDENAHYYIAINKSGQKGPVIAEK